MSRINTFLASLICLSGIIFGTTLVHACMGPHERLFPVCDVNAPSTDERVSLIYAYSGAGLSSLELGDQNVVTEVVDVQVKKTERPHYIALSSGKPIIWRFTGETNTISRIVVFGSQLVGAKYAGIVGVPQNRIIFVKTEINAIKSHNANSCQSVYRACEMSAYFNIPFADRMQLKGAEPKTRQSVDQFVERLEGHTIRIPENDWSEAPKRGRWKTIGNITKMTGPAAGRYEYYFGDNYLESSQQHARGVIEIDASLVVSQVPVKPYTLLPAEHGLKQLVEKGILFKNGTPEFKVKYQRWDEELSAPYRSPLDPNFQFSFDVDYLVSASTDLPSALSKMVFLLAADVPTPGSGGNSSSNACLFFEEPSGFHSPQVGNDGLYCDGSFVFALRDRDRDMIRELHRLNRMRQKKDETNTVSCKQLELEPDVHFAAISASEGSAWRAAAWDKSRRTVEVEINRAGKIALFLDMHGGRTDWRILPSSDTQLVKVILQNLYDGQQADTASLNGSILKTNSFSYGALSKSCKDFHVTSKAFLGGPAAIQLNESLKILTGHSVDQLVRNENDGSWPSVPSNNIESFVKFKID